MARDRTEWDHRVHYRTGDEVWCHVDGSRRVYVALQDNLCSPPPNFISAWRECRESGPVVLATAY